MNYAESLVYWYLRFNGFFPLVNFVLHRYDGSHNADCDLLAIRPAGVYEVVGGGVSDWDHARFQEWGIESEQDTVVLMVEVKSGRFNPKAVDSCFSRERCRMALQRSGYRWNRAADDLTSRFYVEKRVQVNSGVLAKLLVAEKWNPESTDRWFHMTLSAIDDFVVNRMERYPEKDAARMFFPDTIAQYLAWKHSRRTEDNAATER